MQKYFAMELENSELKFENKLLKLQLNTLRNQKSQVDNENRFQLLKDVLKQCYLEFKEVVRDQERVCVRMNGVFELFKDTKFDCL
jgi:hypothetical protein